LDKIVKYTYEYGVVHAKRWKDISRKDLLLLFCSVHFRNTKKEGKTLEFVLVE
jgi:hypothetical protein